jgi:hypothetical protein
MIRGRPGSRSAGPPSCGSPSRSPVPTSPSWWPGCGGRPPPRPAPPVRSGPAAPPQSARRSLASVQARGPTSRAHGPPGAARRPARAGVSTPVPQARPPHARVAPGPGRPPGATPRPPVRPGARGPFRRQGPPPRDGAGPDSARPPIRSTAPGGSGPTRCSRTRAGRPPSSHSPPRARGCVSTAAPTRPPPRPSTRPGAPGDAARPRTARSCRLRSRIPH